MKKNKLIVSALTVSLLSTGLISTNAFAAEENTNNTIHSNPVPVHNVNMNLNQNLLLEKSINPTDLKNIEGI
ncbi:hypothetical protein MHI17_32435, partial [Bacillus sp. FSL L8-0098]